MLDDAVAIGKVVQVVLVRVLFDGFLKRLCCTGVIAGFCAGAAAVGDRLHGLPVRGLRLLINPGSPNSEVNALVHPPDDFSHLNHMFLVSSNPNEEEFGERNERRKDRRGEKR
jgi:hypothetical protein